MGVGYIGARASTAMEINQAPPLLRYTEDQEDTQEDWGQRSQGWCDRTMGVPTHPAPPLGSRFHLGSFACMAILVMLVSDYDSTRSQRDKAKMHLIKLNQEYSKFKFHMIL